MNVSDPVLFHQLHAIRQIVRDETWLEAERRGCCVLSDDRIVRDNVCRVVLRIGGQLRESAQPPMEPAPRTIQFPDWPEAV